MRATTMRLAASLAALAIGTELQTVHACTMLAVGKNATADGSTLIAHTDDAGGGAADLRLVHVPAMDHAPGAKRAVYNFFGGFPRLVTNERGPQYAPSSAGNASLTIPLGYVPQVNHTYAYFDQDYGMVNEKQLSIAESTCGAKTVGWGVDAGEYGYNLFGIAELSKIALERCDSARCAIQTMGDLAVEYGFFSEDSGDPAAPGYIDSAETLGLTDKYGEVWIFHVLTGPQNASAVWAAQRVPDDHVVSVANALVIRQMDLEDKNNFMASSNVLTVAKDMGWWNESTPFDFTAAYGYEDTDPVHPLYTGRRVWRIFDRVAPSLQLDARLGQVSQYVTYPFSVRPDALLTTSDVMDLLRDYYQDTPYDLSKGHAAGPFGSPIRWDGDAKGVLGGWERPISSFRTIYSYVAHVRGFLPDSIGCVVWYGQNSPHATVYVPFSCRQRHVPSAYYEHAGKQSQVDLKSAWWAFNFVKNWSQLRFDRINVDIQARIRAVQTAAFDARDAMERHALALYKESSTIDSIDATKAIDAYLETHANAFAARVVDDWWQFAWTLVGKFADGYVTTGEQPNEMETLGYPKWWLATTEFAQWPGKSWFPQGAIHSKVQPPATAAPVAVLSNTSANGSSLASTEATITNVAAVLERDASEPNEMVAIAQIGGGVAVGMLLGAAIMWLVDMRRRVGYRQVV